MVVCISSASFNFGLLMTSPRPTNIPCECRLLANHHHEGLELSSREDPRSTRH